MSYITVSIKAEESLSEILQVELSGLGFEAFLENEEGFETSIEKDQYHEGALKEILQQYGVSPEEALSTAEVEKQNWNKLWESNFHPISIGSECYVRAHFHDPQPQYKYELVVTPKMSFGTGHHATTSQMIQQQLKLDFQGKRVFDIGCGTGILGIMAGKLGAAHIDVCDVEDWSVENSLENAEINGIHFDKAYQGTAQEQLSQTYDILLANINRNVLLEEMPVYSQLLEKGGYLLLSGFRPEDMDMLENRAASESLKKLRHSQEGEWCCMLMQKN